MRASWPLSVGPSRAKSIRYTSGPPARNGQWQRSLVSDLAGAASVVIALWHPLPGAAERSHVHFARMTGVMHRGSMGSNETAEALRRVGKRFYHAANARGRTPA